MKRNLSGLRIPFWKLKRRSISKELTISLMLLIFFFDGIMLLIVYDIQRRSYYRELQVLANSYAENLTQVLSVPLWDYDDEQIVKIGSGYLGNHAVAKLRISDVDGKVLFDAGSEIGSGRPIERHVDILHGDQTIGHVNLYLSPDQHAQELVWLRNAILLILAASLAAILVMTGILLRIFMRRPLTILQSGIDRVARGDYDYPLEEVRQSELSGIAARFKDMARTVRDRERSLQQEIAERHRAEEMIRESEAKSRALLNAIPDLMFRFDRQGTFLEFKGHGDIPHFEPKHLLGRKVGDVLPADIAAVMQQRLEEALITGRIQIFEYELHIEEELRYFECRLVSLSADQAVAIVRDITQRIEASAERERLEERLLRARKMEAIGTLAGGVAHDLNNVLSGIVSYPELILMDLPTDSPLRKPIQTIQRSGEKAANIVQDLLTLARRGVSVAEVVNLNDLIADFLKSPEFDKLKTYHPNFDLTLDLEKDLLNTIGSPIHLSKTLMNLVSNGVEALSSRGTICIRSRNLYVDVPVRGYDEVAPGDYVVLTVTDDGIGISSRDKDRIFEPFYTKKVMGRSGTGLGMAVVWGTVKDHRGYIDIDSRVGQGTSVSVYLPASRHEVSHRSSGDDLSHIVGRGETILVVDDMPEQLEIATKMLEKLGYRAVAAGNGREAVQYLADHSVDLVILDMIMQPDMDGLDTYREILSIRPGQKAIIASGYSETVRVREAQKMGAGNYIRKPYLLQKVGAVVRAELDR